MLFKISYFDNWGILAIFVNCIFFSKQTTINTTIMIKNNVNLTAGKSYETPLTVTVVLHSEGVLCQSGDLTIKDWERDENGLDF